MSGLLTAVSVVAVACGLTIAVLLYRSRSKTTDRWTREQRLALLAIGVSLLGVIVPLIVSATSGDGDGESAAVTDYRQRVRSVCADLRSPGDSLLGAMRDDGTIDRKILRHGMQNQLDASRATVQQLWKQAPPSELASGVTAAQRAGTTYFQAVQAKINRIPKELPRYATFQQWAAYTGGLTAALRPPGSQFEAAMSALAKQTCAAPAAVPSR